MNSRQNLKSKFPKLYRLLYRLRFLVGGEQVYTGARGLKFSINRYSFSERLSANGSSSRATSSNAA
jgi:hypothetical protein